MNHISGIINQILANIEVIDETDDQRGTTSSLRRRNRDMGDEAIQVAAEAGKTNQEAL